MLRGLGRRDVGRLLAIAAIGLWGQMVLIYFGINDANSAIAAIIVGLEPVLIACGRRCCCMSGSAGERAPGSASAWPARCWWPDSAARTAPACSAWCCCSAPASLLVVHGREQGFLDRAHPLELIAAVSILGALWALLLDAGRVVC